MMDYNKIFKEISNRQNYFCFYNIDTKTYSMDLVNVVNGYWTNESLLICRLENGLRVPHNTLYKSNIYNQKELKEIYNRQLFNKYIYYKKN